MQKEELLQLITLTQVPHIGDVHTKTLLQHFGSAQAVFKARKHELERLPGIGSVRAAAIRRSRYTDRAERELQFIEKYRIQAIAFGDSAYPSRLLPCYDAPALLYYKGTCDLNQRRMISIVGTRDPSDYGRDWLRKMMADLAAYQPVIVSGLAYGIDTLAHREALHCGLQTLGVMAHGLDRIYPHANHELAREMTAKGGLLTDFKSGTAPDAQNFPRRNRIIAGLSDAVIVVESGDKGGSMITVDIANSYHKDVFALPGRATDSRSSGCNRLIREHRAQLVTDAIQIAELLNWDTDNLRKRQRQPSLFPDLNEPQQRIIDLLKATEALSIDSLHQQTGFKPSLTASTLLSLEMMGLVQPLPGKLYRLS